MKPKTGVARLLEIAGERKGFLVASGLLSVVSAAFMLVPYVAVYYILAELLKKGGDLSLVDGDMISRWGLIALGGLMAGLVFTYVSGLASHVAAFRILYGLRVRLAEHLGKLHLGYLNQTSTGAIKKTLEQNVEKIEKFVAHQIPDLINVAATVLIMFVAMFFLEAWMAVVCLISISIGFGIQVGMMYGKESDAKVQQYYDTLERINASSIEYVRGMPAVKVFGQTVHSFKKFYHDLTSYRDLVTSWADQFQTGFVLFKTLLASFLSIIFPVGVLLLSREPQNMAMALVILFFIVMVPGTAAPLYKVMYLSSSIRDMVEGVRRIDAVFAEPPVKEPEHPEHPLTHEVSFEHVSFTYDQTDASTRTEALTDISFTAKEGAVTALVGPSGSGKTTIANLLPRFWDVAQGVIRIGGCDIRNMCNDELMSNVAFVFQETFLFYDTLYANILVGRPDATLEEVIAASRAAQCHDFIERLPQGYDTLIGESGVYLSGGEEQRVSVARAILKNAPILVLDEATAFSDPENEHKMQLALGELIKNKTVIVIAHRLSTIRNAENIVVLDEGRVAESGTHDQLVAMDGLYQRMWNAYMNASAWVFKKERTGHELYK